MGIGPSTGVETKEANILKSGQAAINVLLNHLGAVQSPNQISTIMTGQVVLCILALFTLLFTNLYPDGEIAVGRGKGKLTESTELAYGSLAYIESNARPTIH